MRRIAIIGLGHVGLPLALAFAEADLEVFGLDIDVRKIDQLQRGRSYVQDVSDDHLQRSLSRFKPGTDSAILQEVEAAIICVSTPLSKTRAPDVSSIIAATEEIARHLHPGMLIILESTTYPGTTEEVVRPRLEAGGLKAGQDFFLAFSPNRIDPGNRVFTIRNTPKVIGGVTPGCTEQAASLYRRVVDRVVPVSSATTAEFIKLLENTFRVVNIGLVNELAVISRRMDLNIWEVIEAAATKPFGFMPFYPGPGIGGHCLNKDPLYLCWRARGLDLPSRFIELADEVNRRVPEQVVGLIADALNGQGKSINGSKIVLLGVAYKKNVGDVRESPALEILELLLHRGGQIVYHDPLVPMLDHHGCRWHSAELDAALLRRTDCTVILADHEGFDWRWVVEHSKLVVDTRNATREIGAVAKIYRL